MTSPVAFVAQTPTSSGGDFEFVACGVSGEDTIPLFDGLSNILMVTNSDPTNAHTVTLYTLPDQWGLTPAVTFIIPAAGAYFVILNPLEFGALASLTYDTAEGLSVALVQT